MFSIEDGWYQDLDADGNIRWYNLDTDEEGPVVQYREDMQFCAFYSDPAPGLPARYLGTGWALDLDAEGNLRWFHSGTGEAGPVYLYRELA